MNQLADRCIVFADLRGSTGLFERLGNTQATHVVTSSVASLCGAVEACGGTVIKTLGDGLMASFREPAAAVRAAQSMHEALQQPEVSAGDAAAGLTGSRPDLKLQVALAHGEVVETDGDCFGDAVNVAARLLDHAGDNEILVTVDVVSQLSALAQRRFRNLDHIAVRGRAEAVHVFLTTPQRVDDFAATRLDASNRTACDRSIQLSWDGHQQQFSSVLLPLTFGRSPQATWCIDDSRVSRLHARIDWTGSTFLLSDMSYNGSFVRFDHDPEVLTLRRARCTLHGSGEIGFGSLPQDQPAQCLRFEVLRSANGRCLAATAQAEAACAAEIVGAA